MDQAFENVTMRLDVALKDNQQLIKGNESWLF